MGLLLVTGPVIEPVSVQELRTHCRIDSATEDGLLASYLFSARAFLEEETGRALMSQTWDYTIDDEWPVDVYGKTVIELPRAPLRSVVSVSYVDDSGVTQTMLPAQYVVDVSSRVGRISPADGVTWPTVQARNAVITVRFVCGYGDNPGSHPDLYVARQAIMLIAAHMYENREAVSGASISELPMGARAFIDRLRVYY